MAGIGMTRAQSAYCHHYIPTSPLPSITMRPNLPKNNPLGSFATYVNEGPDCTSSVDVYIIHPKPHVVLIPVFYTLTHSGTPSIVSFDGRPPYIHTLRIHSHPVPT